MSALTLVIGNKAYSSWSLRGWLALRRTGAPFEEVVVPLDQPDTAARIAAHSPSGRVPALRDGDRVVWDSLAIVEYLAERFPAAGLWPADATARAFARSISAEMHAGFAPLRRHLPMDLKRAPAPVEIPPEVAADIARIRRIWAEARARFGEGGPYLFGPFSAADAMYAPVATRFATYAVALDPEAQAYVDAIYAWPAFRDWLAAARAEPWTIEQHTL